MISAVAFCPHPPLLIPEVAQGAAGELEDVRAACRAAIKRVADVSAQLLVLGAGSRLRHHDPSARGSLAPYGVDCEIPLGSDAPGPVELPLSLTVGAWLLRDALGADNGAAGWSIGAQDVPARLDTDASPRSMLVMADGSARRSTSAPGYFDERAGAFDSRLADALRTGTPGGLRLDRGLAAELLVDGAQTWDQAAVELDGSAWEAELLYDGAPYGVGYFVAVWTRRA